MKNIFVILMAMAVFCSPFVNSVHAGQIHSQEMSQIEFENALTMEDKSEAIISSIECGGDDGLALIGGVFLVLILIAAVAGSGAGA